MVPSPAGTGGGRIEAVDDVLGVPLGVGGHPFETTEVDLPEGAVLAPYTDGLIEAHGRDIDQGAARLRAELADVSGPLEDAADRILARLLPGPPHDDTVLVLARVTRAA
ncbi:SpoIIE family protein phosphatase [Streptomyces sp. NPDC002133]|uniref:SpoIIE family protein phosphatase n=1 Tax=Streptomyces sp. NPDC002133 TaxID=3154409 RepID=UPI003323A494